MKSQLAQVTAVVIVAGLPLFTSISARAEADASALLSYSSLTINPQSGSFQMTSGLSPSYSAQPMLNGQPVVGYSPMVNCYGNCSMTPSGPNPFQLNISSSANSSVALPGQVIAFGQGAGHAGITGGFQITGGSGAVSVSFSVPETGSLSVFTDAYGQSAFAETKLTLSLNGSPVMVDDRSFSIGSFGQESQNISCTEAQSVMLNFNQQYSFNLSVDVQSWASNVPEPSAGLLMLVGLAGFLMVRRYRVARS